jgi:hypothetical protein
MTFLRITTLSAAIASFLVFALDLAGFVIDFSRDTHFLYGLSSLRLAGIFVWLLFYLALTAFFSALFLRQKG